MMMYPDVQSHAQHEVDEIIAKQHRLPNVLDRGYMPYLEAVLKEVLRWAPPSPMGLFHYTTRDDEYKGYFIPKKTTVIANIWEMLHDPQEYPEPFKFSPDRFYNADGSAPVEVQRNPLELAFGFGRRICPGQHVAEATIFMQMVTFLSVLNVSKGVYSDGRTIEPNIEFTTAIVRYVVVIFVAQIGSNSLALSPSHIKPFAYSITRRCGKGIDFLKQDLEVDE